MSTKKYLLITGLSLIALGTECVRASNGIAVNIIVDNDGGFTHYSAGVFPSFSHSTLQYSSYSLSNDDGSYVSTNGGGFQTTFDNFAGLVNALEEPWTLVLDAGLTTQRDFSASLSLGNLARWI